MQLQSCMTTLFTQAKITFYSFKFDKEIPNFSDKNQMKNEPMPSSKIGPAKRKMADRSIKQQKTRKNTSETGE